MNCAIQGALASTNQPGSGASSQGSIPGFEEILSAKTDSMGHDAAVVAAASDAWSQVTTKLLDTSFSQKCKKPSAEANSKENADTEAVPQVLTVPVASPAPVITAEPRTLPGALNGFVLPTHCDEPQKTSAAIASKVHGVAKAVPQPATEPIASSASVIAAQARTLPDAPSDSVLRKHFDEFHEPSAAIDSKGNEVTGPASQPATEQKASPASVTAAHARTLPDALSLPVFPQHRDATQTQPNGDLVTPLSLQTKASEQAQDSDAPQHAAPLPVLLPNPLGALHTENADSARSQVIDQPTDPFRQKVNVVVPPVREKKVADADSMIRGDAKDDRIGRRELLEIATAQAVPATEHPAASSDFQHSAAPERSTLPSPLPAHNQSSATDLDAGDRTSSTSTGELIPNRSILGSVTNTKDIIQTARLIEQVNRSELRVNLLTSELGKIDIHGSITRHEFSANIYLENHEAGKALQAIVSTLETKLSEEHHVIPTIHLHPGTLFNADGNRHSQPQQQRSQDAALHAVDSSPAIRVTSETELIPGNANLDALLDIHA